MPLTRYVMFKNENWLYLYLEIQKKIHSWNVNISEWIKIWKLEQKSKLFIHIIYNTLIIEQNRAKPSKNEHGIFRASEFEQNHFRAISSSSLFRARFFRAISSSSFVERSNFRASRAKFRANGRSVSPLWGPYFQSSFILHVCRILEYNFLQNKQFSVTF